MPALLELTGQRFMRLVALRRVTSGPGIRVHKWECRCDCGTIRVVAASALRSGNSKSCGCLQREKAAISVRKHHPRLRQLLRKHGMANTPTHSVWSGMRGRCNRPKHKNYGDYGGRGIRVCERWRKFENFLADMGERPTAKHTLERVNNDGNYEPTNCCWALRTTQSRNRRSNRMVTLDGATKCLAEWAEQYGIGYHIVYRRIERGWTIRDALTTPVGPPICRATSAAPTPAPA